MRRLWCVLLTGFTILLMCACSAQTRNDVQAYEYPDRTGEPRLVLEDYLNQRQYCLGRAALLYCHYENENVRNIALSTHTYCIDPEILEWKQLAQTLYVACVEAQYVDINYNKLNNLFYVGWINNKWYVITGYKQIPAALLDGVDLEEYIRMEEENLKEEFRIRNELAGRDPTSGDDYFYVE